MSEEKIYTSKEYEEVIVTLGNSLGALFIVINNAAIVSNDILAVLSKYSDIISHSYREYLKREGIEVPSGFENLNNDDLANELFKFTKKKDDGSDLVM